MAFSNSSVAAVHCVAVIVPAGACTAKCALWHCSGSPDDEPGSVHVPATHWAAAGGVVAQLLAHAVVAVPGSQVPLLLELELVLEVEVELELVLDPLELLLLEAAVELEAAVLLDVELGVVVLLLLDVEPALLDPLPLLDPWDPDELEPALDIALVETPLLLDPLPEVVAVPLVPLPEDVEPPVLLGLALVPPLPLAKLELVPDPLLVSVQPADCCDPHPTISGTPAATRTSVRTPRIRPTSRDSSAKGALGTQSDGRTPRRFKKSDVWIRRESLGGIAPSHRKLLPNPPRRP